MDPKIVMPSLTQAREASIADPSDVAGLRDGQLLLLHSTREAKKDLGIPFPIIVSSFLPRASFSEAPACFFVEHPHQQPSLLINFMLEKEVDQEESLKHLL